MAFHAQSFARGVDLRGETAPAGSEIRVDPRGDGANAGRDDLSESDSYVFFFTSFSFSMSLLPVGLRCGYKNTNGMGHNIGSEASTAGSQPFNLSQQTLLNCTTLAKFHKIPCSD